jgi:L-alanine-DL-glutamate epimerase-like enolase superfamily enzyme
MRTDPTVASVDAAAYRIPTSRPEGDGTLTWDATTWVVVHVTTADPALPCGVGWTYAPAAAAQVVTTLLADSVCGRPAHEVASAWHAMVRAVRNAGRPGLVGMALSAVDTALWDLRARLLGLPLDRLLGRVNDDVAVYGSGGFTTDPEPLLKVQLEAWAARGFDRVKIKIGESAGTRVDRDLKRVALARRTVGDDVALYTDANGGYSAGQAVRVARRLEDHGVSWLEEPVSSDDHEGLRHVRDHTSLDVAAGEYGDSLAYYSHLLSAHPVDCVQVDVTRCGGYTEWLRIAALAAAQGLEVSGHCAPSLTVPVALATPGLRHLEWFEDHEQIESRYLEGWRSPQEGRVGPSADPGHGYAVREQDLRDLRVA